MQQFESFAQMQRDAEMRVMEMQKRAMAAVEGSDPPPIIIPHQEQDGRERGEAQPTAPRETPDNPTSALKELLPGLNLSDDDAERALLIAVLLLIREQADRNLIFLLLYLLLS